MVERSFVVKVWMVKKEKGRRGRGCVMDILKKGDKVGLVVVGILGDSGSLMGRKEVEVGRW